MIIYAVITIGRQIQGEEIMVRFEKVFTDQSRAESFAKNLPKMYTENNGQTQFVCERGIHLIDVE